MKKQILYVWLASMSLACTSSGMQPAALAEALSTSSTHKQAVPETVQTRRQVVDTKAAANGAPGMRAYKDPKTGKLGPPPPSERSSKASLEMDRAVSTESEDLVEVPSPVPGGGVMVDLKGRFQSHTKATKDAEGEVTIDCIVEPAAKQD